MGRVKLKIKRLENINGRQATYAKRKNGIIKKATELSILCDIDIILLMFSPSGKPSLCRGRRSFEEVIAKFSQQTPQERAKRKLESLEDLSNQARLLQTQISETQKRLSQWKEFEKINNVEQLEQMENSLRDSINQIRNRKEHIKNQQLVSLQCNNQFNDMHIPFRMGAEQHLQPLPWIGNGDSPNLVLPDDSSLLLHK
ncbi:hypothetical protein PIB30_008777 [Stylosanthes scabra]|uniref:MADS-box domain-containing protein n=1 Tax=Stylosanthes scabra TaxID=79078 RepID=A0ABU6W552_9FABA|nr:hypothetical protein [Stylosanthes scabra]